MPETNTDTLKLDYDLDKLPTLRAWTIEFCGLPQDASDKLVNDNLVLCYARKEITDELVRVMVKKDITKRIHAMVQTKKSGDQKMATKPTTDEILDSGSRVRIIPASERYSTDRPVGKHQKTGESITYHGELVRLPSKRQLASVGAWFKHWLNGSRHKHVLQSAGVRVPVETDHDKQLCEELYHKGQWCGTGADGRYMECASLEGMGLDTKTLLNDSTSGGEDAVPTDLDATILTDPLLTGELWPFVTHKSTNRDSVRALTMSTPEVAWGEAEGSQISLLNTDDLMDSISVDVENMSLAVEWGLDLESDSPAAIGATLQQVIGERMRAELDNAVINGNGTSQPQGILNAVGTTAVSAAGGAGAAPQVDDYENLMFGVAKQYRVGGYGGCFIANDTSYSRARAIAVGAADVRRVFGMNEQSYRLLEWPYRIQNDIPNAVQLFVGLKNYVAWERSGVEVKITTEGKELARKHQKLLVMRRRLAGRLVRPAACALVTDGQA